MIDLDRCDVLTQRIEKSFQTFDTFKDVLDYSAVFNIEKNRYKIQVNNTYLQGFQETTIEATKNCRANGRQSMSMKFQLNLGNPKIVSDVYYTLLRDKHIMTKKVQVEAYASIDVSYDVETVYLDFWKRMFVINVNPARTSKFESDSDCSESVKFCHGLHTRLDQGVWSAVYHQIPYLLKHVVFKQN